MKIFGYSERGAMNALFYGMAHDNEHGEEALKVFIKDLAKVKRDFSDFEFELYNEFSLSEFGDPDMMIIAKDEKGEKIVFFIEAKRSGFKLSLEKDHHKQYMESGGFENGHSSNLFFQLRLKHYFFEVFCRKRKDDYYKSLEDKIEAFFKKECFKVYDEMQLNRLKKSKNRNRKIGENVVVNHIVEQIKDSIEAYYIAIIPEQDPKWNDNEVNTGEFGFSTITLTWERIYNYKEYDFKTYLKDTIEFNQGKDRNKKEISQILNYPEKDCK